MALQSTLGTPLMDADKVKRLDSFEADLNQYTVVERLEMIERIVRSLTSMAIHFDGLVVNQKKAMANLLEELSQVPSRPDPFAGLSHDEVLYDKLQ